MFTGIEQHVQFLVGSLHTVLAIALKGIFVRNNIFVLNG